jgi:hypothetical protein
MLFFEQNFSYVTFPFLGGQVTTPGVSTPTAKRFGCWRLRWPQAALARPCVPRSSQRSRRAAAGIAHTTPKIVLPMWE